MELFANLNVFAYLVLAALVLALLWYAGSKRKAKIKAALFSRQNYASLIPPGLLARRRLADILFLTGVFFLFIALAGPQWGREKVDIEAHYSQVVIAVDVSNSMLAQDIKPNRLENAKMMLSMFIENMANERLGIIAFTSQAFIQSPITTDTAALKTLAGALSTKLLPVQGTALAPAISLAAKMLEPYPGTKALLLITDGEGHDPQDIEAALKIARDNSIKIIAVGIGSKEGELIPEILPDGTKTYKKDKEGRAVLTKLDEETLIKIARATGGAYIKYISPQQVADEAAVLLTNLDKTAIQRNQGVIYTNRYQLALFPAFLLLLASILIPLRKVK